MLPVIYRTPLANAITRSVGIRPVIAAALVGLGITGCAHYTPKPLVPERTGMTLESRSLSDPGLRVFIEKNLGHTLADWPLQTWNLDLLTLVAFYYSPELDVSRARWSAADAAVVTAGMRPNPSLNIAPEFSTNSPAGVSPWLPAISLDVPIETAGKRGHRMDEAQQLSESARWRVVTTAWGVRRKLTGALLDYTVVRHREALSKRQFDLQAQIVRMEEGELTAGAVAGSDVTVARIQLAKTRLDLEATRAQVAETRARSADALGIPLRALDGADLMFLFDPTDASALTSEEARRRALTSRSDVLGALAEYEAAQAALQLEIAKQYPDIHLGPGYQWDQGQDKWLVGLTFELPVFNRNQGPIAEAIARRTEAEARFVALQTQIIHEIDAATAALKAADESSLSGDNLLAAQRQNLEAVEGQLEAGAVGALEVASAQIDAANAESLAFEAIVRRQQAVRALEDAVQRPLGSEADARAAVLQIESTQRSPR
ncbi:MAG TPA: TolC family protein [Steroidobacteraceae bacterium]|nr:TolC family protein [Steroidobacteraceae bacterium]